MKRKKIWGSLHPFYEGGAVLGRRVANRRFIQALLRRDPFDAYHFFLPTPQDCEDLRATLHREYAEHKDEAGCSNYPGLLASGRLQIRLRRELPAALAATEYHCFHLSDCFTQFVELMRLRNALAANIFPITGTTHSLSYAEYGQKFLQQLWGGVSPRDAVTATSSAGRAVVLAMYESLRRSYGLDVSAFPNPQVRVLPLGVEPADMPLPEEKAALRAKKRAELGIEPGGQNGYGSQNVDQNSQNLTNGHNGTGRKVEQVEKTQNSQAGRGFSGSQAETVFLIFARISYLSKMDLLPVLRACKRAEKLGLGRYSLLLAGWQEEGDAFGEEFVRLASALGIKVRLVLRPDDAERKALYAAADVFLSPSDNLQETFGLTMLEAAAASLPVIASDFDGYRDLVLPGETGLLIPTLGPMDTADTEARAAIIPAAEYHLRLAEQCVVDVPALARAMSDLAARPDLRLRMGQAARERVLRDYSWERVIDLHLELWDELAGTELTPEQESGLRAARHPAYPSYTDAFAGYYTRTLPESAGSIHWTGSGEAVYRGLDFPVIYSIIEDSVPLEALKRLLFAARRPVPVNELAERFARAGGADRDFLLLWALKHDLLEII